MAVGGGLALFAIALAPLADLFKLRWRRIWAIALLSLKDAVRRKVLWAFLALLLVFLFGSWFIDSKPENQVRSYVQVLYWVQTPLLLVTITWLAAFSIPTDIKNQTIHTILTKPVERFEIVLGRFLGFGILMSGVLVVTNGLSLLYLFREIHPDAAYESLKARVPVYGDLSFWEGNESGQETQRKGENVGREWEYRSYIQGKATRTQYAVWQFNDLPADLAGRASVPCEFAFDVYRTLKGESVTCTFAFRAKHSGDVRGQARRDADYEQELQLERRNDPEFDAFLDEWLSVKYGYYKSPSNKIVDYHTFAIQAPGGLFLNPVVKQKEYLKEAANPETLPAEYRQLVQPLHDEKDPARRLTLKQNMRSQLEAAERGMAFPQRKAAFLYRELPSLDAKVQALEAGVVETNRAPLSVWVNCETRAQFVGMAKRDLYLLDANQPFWLNFFKGSSGLWFRLLLVTGLAVALSTYLSGVISWLTTMFLLMLGLFSESFIKELAAGGVPGGGPMESLMRLVKREALASELEETAAVKVATTSDTVFQWMMRRLINFIPDVDRYSFTDYVAEGFNIPNSELVMNLLLLAAYLLPWAIAAYYFFKWREVASST
jgi:ABC-type transport system involved in multi-copper enzyme maturation permease subunit